MWDRSHLMAILSWPKVIVINIQTHNLSILLSVLTQSLYSAHKALSLDKLLKVSRYNEVQFQVKLYNAPRSGSDHSTN